MSVKVHHQNVYIFGSFIDIYFYYVKQTCWLYSIAKIPEMGSPISLLTYLQLADETLILV